MLGININYIYLELIFTIFYHNTTYQQFSFSSVSQLFSAKVPWLY